MKKINSAIDRFCYQHPRFGIPNLMLWVVIGNVIVYVMDMMSRGTFSAMLSFVPAYIFQGQIWRLVTFVLVPNYGSNIFFFAISAYFTTLSVPGWRISGGRPGLTSSTAPASSWPLWWACWRG